MPYSVSVDEELPEAVDTSYDTGGKERLFDHVPGAAVYLGEWRVPDETPRNWSVVCASLGTDERWRLGNGIK